MLKDAILDILRNYFCKHDDIKPPEDNDFLLSDDILAEAWNTKWPKANIKYRFQGEYYRESRTLINYPSYIAQDIVKKYNLKKNTEEETLFAILNFCDKEIPYAFDINNYNVNEMWEDSDIILQKMRDDCDGKAIVFKALALACDVPDYKIKVCAGWVIKPGTKSDKVGHAYPIYLWNNNWYVLDPTYYPDYTAVKDRKVHKDLDNYYPIEKPIWWTFTKEFCFAQKDIEL